MGRYNVAPREILGSENIATRNRNAQETQNEFY